MTHSQPLQMNNMKEEKYLARIFKTKQNKKNRQIFFLSILLPRKITPQNTVTKFSRKLKKQILQ